MTTKRFPASAKKLKKLRKDGQIPISRAVCNFAALLGALVLFGVSDSWVRIGTLVQWSSRDGSTPVHSLWAALSVCFSLVVCAAGATALSGVVAAMWQSGWLVSLSSFKNGFQKVQPLSYISRLREGVTDGALGLVRSTIVWVMLLPVVYALVMVSGMLLDASSADALAVLTSFIRSVVLRGAGTLGLIAVASYALVRWRFFARNKMSLEELREEYKQEEGDPYVRAARRHEHQMLALGELEKRVRNAKVIVVRRSSAQASGG
jgi:flagellar biosynthesis protein FlhB